MIRPICPVGSQGVCAGCERGSGRYCGENGADRGGTAADIICKFRNLEMFKIGRLFIEKFFWNRYMSFICITIIYKGVVGLRRTD